MVDGPMDRNYYDWLGYKERGIPKIDEEKRVGVWGKVVTLMSELDFCIDKERLSELSDIVGCTPEGTDLLDAVGYAARRGDEEYIRHVAQQLGKWLQKRNPRSTQSPGSGDNIEESAVQSDYTPSLTYGERLDAVMGVLDRNCI